MTFYSRDDQTAEPFESEDNGQSLSHYYYSQSFTPNKVIQEINMFQEIEKKDEKQNNWTDSQEKIYNIPQLFNKKSDLLKRSQNCDAKTSRKSHSQDSIKMNKRKHKSLKKFHKIQTNKDFFIHALLLPLKTQQQQQKIKKEKGENTNLCSSDIYVMQNNLWKNREIIYLTLSTLNNIPIEQVTKLKIKKESPITGYFLFRFSDKVNDSQMGIRYKDLSEWFAKSCWAYLHKKQIYSPLDLKFKQKCEGFLLKKGEIMGNWEKRFVSIDRNQGLSSKKLKQKKPTLIIKRTNEIWTRFQLIENNKYLIIKLWFGPIKEEFAVPVLNLMEWLGGFASLIKQE